jgi:hypothetical protein
VRNDCRKATSALVRAGEQAADLGYDETGHQPRRSGPPRPRRRRRQCERPDRRRQPAARCRPGSLIGEVDPEGLVRLLREVGPAAAEALEVLGDRLLARVVVARGDGPRNCPLVDFMSVPAHRPWMPYRGHAAEHRRVEDLASPRGGFSGRVRHRRRHKARRGTQHVDTSARRHAPLGYAATSGGHQATTSAPATERACRASPWPRSPWTTSSRAVSPSCPSVVHRHSMGAPTPAAPHSHSGLRCRNRLLAQLSHLAA